MVDSIDEAKSEKYPSTNKVARAGPVEEMEARTTRSDPPYRVWKVMTRTKLASTQTWSQRARTVGRKQKFPPKSEVG